jgi:hypothetical protein
MCHGQGHTLVHSLGDVLLAVTLDSRQNLEIRLTEAQEVRAFMSRRIFEPVASCVGFFSLPKIDATSLVISRACSFTRKRGSLNIVHEITQKLGRKSRRDAQSQGKDGMHEKRRTMS